MTSAGKEIEVKLLIDKVAPVRERLRRIGFQLWQPRSLEKNVLYDSSAGSLRKRGALLRLRNSRGHHTLTYKEPVADSKRYKIRREAEIRLADASATKQILTGLGFQPVFRYEKYRTVYRAARGVARGEAVLDETPIGNYLELEGRQAWIRRVAAQLGARPEDFITKDYAALYVEWCRARGRKVAHMTFPRRSRHSA